MSLHTLLHSQHFDTTDVEELYDSSYNDVFIDRRPLPILLLSTYRRAITFVLAALLFFAIYSSNRPEGLTVGGQRTLAVFVSCVIFWITNALPLSVTGLLAIVLLPAVGVMPSEEAFALFGNKVVFFILGAFILAAAAMKSGLTTRIALLVLRRFGSSPERLMVGITASAFCFSLVMSEHAVAAFLFPVVLEIAKSLNLKPLKSQFGKMLFLSTAWGTIIGGIGTLLGGGRAPLAVGMLKQFNGQEISFFKWCAASLPIAVSLIIVEYLLLATVFKSDIRDIQPAITLMEQKIAKMGRTSRTERRIGFLMIVTIVMWMFLGERIGLADISMIAAVALFVLGLVTWRDVEDYVNWGIILMYGGAMALGGALVKSGAAEWLASTLIAGRSPHPMLIVSFIALAAMLLTTVMNNSATVAVILPVAFSLGRQYGIDPGVMVFAVAIPAGLDFCLPVGTPANAICYSSGYYRASEMARIGLLLTIAALVIVLIVGYFYWPLIGLNIGK